jgi:2'-5' RNA ligase
MDTWRLFIAVEVPPSVKDALVAVQQQLQRGSPPVKWVAPAAMHLTLQFLGATDTQLVTSIGAALRQALAGQPACELRLGPPGVFPNARRPSVLWVGIDGATSALEQMQRSIAAALRPLGFPVEARPFRAHLTIGRVRRDASAAQQAHLGSMLAHVSPPPALSWRVTEVILFQSELLREGPRYTARDAVQLIG